EFNIAELAEAFIYDLERQAEPLVLVIDDLHLIYDADWVIPFFHRLLPLLPAETHMLILGRGLLPAPMSRLRSKQQLFVITEQMRRSCSPATGSAQRRRARLSCEQAGAQPVCMLRRSASSWTRERRRPLNPEQYN